MKKHIPLILLSCFLLVFFLLNLFSALHESLTFDEIVHIQEGENALTKHTFQIDTNNPPFIRELQTLPLVLGANKLIPSSQPNMQALPARLVTILLGILLIVGVYFFVLSLTGQPEALFATFLLSLEPTVLGNSHYVTQDIGVTTVFFFSYWLLTKIGIITQWKFILGIGVLMGLGMAAKITFIPYMAITILLFVLFQYRFTLFARLWRAKTMLALTVLIACLVVWATYFFKTNVIIQERKDSNRVSERLLTFASIHHNILLTEAVLFGKNQQVPLGDYIGALKNNALRNVNGPLYYVFKLNDWDLMPLNLFLKVPITLWILAVSGFLFVLTKEKKMKKYFGILIIPLISIGVSAFFLRMHPLVRYVLPLYPFLAIFGGISWGFWQRNLVGKILFAGLLMWYITGTLSSFPHFISYANEFAGYPQDRYKVLVDSNLDWGQSLPDVSMYLKKEKVGLFHLSYFGRDNGDLYGLKSDEAYGSYKLPEICAFHTIHFDGRSKEVTLISLSNWYQCGYYKETKYKNPKGQVSDSFLVF